MNIPTKLSISRPIGGSGESQITIEITDESSGCSIISCSVDLAGFAEAITGRGYVSCQSEFYENCPVGKTREVKTELVPMGQDQWAKPKDQDAIAKKALAPFEVDGWEGRASDLFNGHRASGEFQKVTFIRFVDAKPNDLINAGIAKKGRES